MITILLWICAIFSMAMTWILSNKYTKKPLRSILLTAGVLMIIFSTKPGATVNIHGFEIVTTLLIPVFMPLILMVLLLDALMARVMRSGHKEWESEERYANAIVFNLLVVIIMVIEWIPYFMEI